MQGTTSGTRKSAVSASQSLVAESTSAARGVFALTIGNRQAPALFDLTRHGLCGSFIALLGVALITAVVPMLLGTGGPPGALTLEMLSLVIFLVLQVALSAIALRQFKRLDGLVPFLVADNWMNVVVTVIAVALAFTGIGLQNAALGVGLIAIVNMVNNARLVVKLSAMQIVIFLIARLIGGLLAILLVAMLVGVSPETLTGV